jgi:hypothetical protein
VQVEGAIGRGWEFAEVGRGGGAKEDMNEDERWVLLRDRVRQRHEFYLCGLTGLEGGFNLWSPFPSAIFLRALRMNARSRSSGSVYTSVYIAGSFEVLFEVIINFDCNTAISLDLCLQGTSVISFSKLSNVRASTWSSRSFVIRKSSRSPGFSSSSFKSAVG